MSKEFVSDVHCDDECDSPNRAMFTMYPNDAANIRNLQKFVVENDLYKIEKFDYRVEWLDYFNEPAHTDSACLNVSGTEFWFSAYLKHTNVEILTDRFLISDLSELQ